LGTGESLVSLSVLFLFSRRGPKAIRTPARVAQASF
jgi:hypothetical protein